MYVECSNVCTYVTRTVNSKVAVVTKMCMITYIVAIHNRNTRLHLILIECEVEVAVYIRTLTGIYCVHSLQLSKARNLVKLTQQPYHYLLEGMQARDGQIQAQKKALEELEKKVASYQEERKALVQQKNELSADLEKLLAHKEVCTCKWQFNDMYYVCASTNSNYSTYMYKYGCI